MRVKEKKKLTVSFLRHTSRAKEDFWFEVKPKALEDVITKEWLVAVYYRRGNRLYSLILLERVDEKKAKQVEELLKELADKLNEELDQ